MPTQKNIYLIGPMGVGKTSIGKRLAKRLGKQFVDSDIEVEKRTGVTISRIFDIEGEAGFRERESKILKELIERKDTVLATGGGVVLSEENRKLLSANGCIIYLQGSPEHLQERTGKSRHRPLLDTADKKARLLEILAQRVPIYEELADITVNTDDRPPLKVVREIISKLGEL
ncbi:MAG: shikimate kinase [Gammaproteobacteria bacterium]